MHERYLCETYLLNITKNAERATGLPASAGERESADGESAQPVTGAGDAHRTVPERGGRWQIQRDANRLHPEPIH